MMTGKNTQTDRQTDWKRSAWEAWCGDAALGRRIMHTVGR